MPFVFNAASSDGGIAAMGFGERDSPISRSNRQLQVYRTVHVATNPQLGPGSVEDERMGFSPATHVAGLEPGGWEAPPVACRNRSTTRALRGPWDCNRNRRLCAPVVLISIRR